MTYHLGGGVLKMHICPALSPFADIRIDADTQSRIDSILYKNFKVSDLKRSDEAKELGHSSSRFLGLESRSCLAQTHVWLLSAASVSSYRSSHDRRYFPNSTSYVICIVVIESSRWLRWKIFILQMSTHELDF